ncbi:hypothetical protein GCM10007052_00700 [Halioglobus japonicus]|nr:hypothetical protein GCM10007052_00700 [Halioglobus japonicus]
MLATYRVAMHLKRHRVGSDKRAIKACERLALRIIPGASHTRECPHRILYQAIAGKKIPPGRPVMRTDGLRRKLDKIQTLLF